MNQQDQQYSDLLSAPQLNRVDEIRDHFKQAWLAGLRPSINDFLAAASEHERPILFAELLAVKVEFRRSNREIIVPEIYKQQFPEHGDLVDAVVSSCVTTPQTPAPESVATVPTPEGSQAFQGCESSLP